MRMYASMVFADSRAACVYWGPDKIAIYNTKFAMCCEGAHPDLMGKSFADGFPTLSDQMLPIFDNAALTAQTIDIENVLMFPERNGFLEE